MPGTVTAQQQSPTTIQSPGFTIRGKRVLAQENILRTVTIEVAHRRCETRSKLSEERQWVRLPPLTEIQKHHGIEGQRLQDGRAIKGSTKDFPHTIRGVGTVRSN